MSNDTTRRQVCLFGTSANPPTGDGGHVGIMKALSNLGRFDEVRVLPVYSHSFASKRKQLVSFQDRINMCRMAFADIPNATVSEAELSLFELKSKGLSENEKQELRVGTADLLEMLLEQEPDSDFSFCLGADTFMDLTSWKWRRSRDVLRLLGGRIIVLHRKGLLNQDLKERVQSLNKDYNGGIVLLNVPDLQEVSSSMARICSEDMELNKMVASNVLDYMKTNKLYAFDESTQQEG